MTLSLGSRWTSLVGRSCSKLAPVSWSALPPEVSTEAAVVVWTGLWEQGRCTKVTGVGRTKLSGVCWVKRACVGWNGELQV